jgi:hypothetical protein
MAFQCLLKKHCNGPNHSLLPGLGDARETSCADGISKVAEFTRRHLLPMLRTTSISEKGKFCFTIHKFLFRTAKNDDFSMIWLEWRAHLLTEARTSPLFSNMVNATEAQINCGRESEISIRHPFFTCLATKTNQARSTISG